MKKEVLDEICDSGRKDVVQLGIGGNAYSGILRRHPTVDDVYELRAKGQRIDSGRAVEVELSVYFGADDVREVVVTRGEARHAIFVPGALPGRAGLS